MKIFEEKAKCRHVYNSLILFLRLAPGAPQGVIAGD